MRCQVVSLQEKPWCTSFRRQVNKHSEEEAKFIWLTFGICKVGLKFLEYETFESYTLCHHQELARGALKQCRETWASSLPFLPTSRSAAALAEPHIVRSAWESSIFLALVDWGRTCCRMTWTAMTQTTRWSVSFLTLPRMGIRLRSQVWNAPYLDQSMLDLAFCWCWSCPPPTLAPAGGTRPSPSWEATTLPSSVGLWRKRRLSKWSKAMDKDSSMWWSRCTFAEFFNATWFSQRLSLYKIFQDFPYFVQTSSPPSVTFPKLINVMSSLIELLRGKCWFPSCVQRAIINISNWQTLLLI